jgi:hypothetical protein
MREGWLGLLGLTGVAVGVFLVWWRVRRERTRDE